MINNSSYYLQGWFPAAGDTGELAVPRPPTRVIHTCMSLRTLSSSVGKKRKGCCKEIRSHKRIAHFKKNKMERNDNNNDKQTSKPKRMLAGFS